MADFEQVFENLDVKVDGLTSAMDNVVASSTDASEVDQLLNEMQSA